LDKCARKRNNSGQIETDSAKLPRLDSKDPAELLASYSSKSLAASAVNSSTLQKCSDIQSMKTNQSVTDEDTSSDDSDVEIPEVVKQVVVKPDVAQNWTNDNESSDENSSPSCYRCSKEIKPGMKYCPPCWRSHQRQFSTRPKPKWRMSSDKNGTKNSEMGRDVSVTMHTESLQKSVESQNKPDSQGDRSSEKRPDTPDTVVESEEMLSQKLGSQEVPRKFDSGFCSTHWSGSIHLPTASASRESSCTALKQELDIKEDSGVDEVDGFSCQDNKIKSEGSVQIKKITEDINIHSKVSENKPVLAISSTLCLLCRVNQKDASLIHGRTGHQVCCYPCGKNIWRQNRRCPVCNRTVEKVVKNIIL
jgi:hypothetical protein